MTTEVLHEITSPHVFKTPLIVKTPWGETRTKTVATAEGLGLTMKLHRHAISLKQL